VCSSFLRARASQHGLVCVCVCLLCIVALAATGGADSLVAVSSILEEFRDAFEELCCSAHAPGRADCIAVVCLLLDCCRDAGDPGIPEHAIVAPPSGYARVHVMHARTFCAYGIVRVLRVFVRVCASLFGVGLRVCMWVVCDRACDTDKIL
jgi:hypothetical protein